MNAFALLSQLGPEPVAMVQGTSVHQVGWQYLPGEARLGGRDLFCGLEVISRAWDDARRAALDRLTQEAAAAGADLVLAVELRRGRHDFGRRTVSFVVTGTAVRLPPGAAPAPASPQLSALSVQEYAQLGAGGWVPAGLLATTSAFFIATGTWTRWQRRRSVLESQERWEYSDGFSAARHAAVSRIRDQARAAGADGVVGMALEYEVATGSFTTGPLASAQDTAHTGTQRAPVGGADKRDGVVVTFHAVGTAIRRAAPAAAPPEPRPLMTLGA